MADITYTTKKYRILQKTSDTTANLMHPETEADIVLIDKVAEDVQGPDLQTALTQLNNKINIAQSAIAFDTKENWDLQPELVSQPNTIYIYTDAFELDGQDIAGIKIGDGNAYLKDKVFVTDLLATQIAELITQFQAHLADNVRHITSEERTKWNNKLNYELSEQEPETLIFNRN